MFCRYLYGKASFIGDHITRGYIQREGAKLVRLWLNFSQIIVILERPNLQPKPPLLVSLCVLIQE